MLFREPASSGTFAGCMSERRRDRSTLAAVPGGTRTFAHTTTALEAGIGTVDEGVALYASCRTSARCAACSSRRPPNSTDGDGDAEVFPASSASIAAIAF